MTRVLRTLIATGVVALVSAPVRAHADAFLVPWVGSVFGGDAATRRTTLGVSAGDLGGGPVGFDVELGYASKFFGDEMEFGSNSLITVMADAILGPLLESGSGARIRPYVTGGVGLIRSRADGGTVFTAPSTVNSFGWNAGAGVMGYFSGRFGLRGDVRYLRAVDNHLTVDPLAIASGAFRFWRATVGVVVR
jgi:hypothetical protein